MHWTNAEKKIQEQVDALEARLTQLNKIRSEDVSFELLVQIGAEKIAVRHALIDAYGHLAQISKS